MQGTTMRLKTMLIFLLAALLFILLFTSCTKNIDMDNVSAKTSYPQKDKEEDSNDKKHAAINTDLSTSIPSDPGNEPEIVRITISAAGDTTLGINSKMSYSGSFDEYYDRYGSAYFLKNVHEILAKDDFTIVNLEGPLTTSNEKQKKLYNHKGKPEYVSILKDGSVEAVSLSNNHTLDYGLSGYQDTVEALTNAGIAWASNDSYGIFETKGIKIGFVSVDEHYNGSLIEGWLESGITRLKEQGADLVIACIHWGRAEDEKTSRISEYQIELSQKCIDWGYDLVIGNHAHVLQGINRYKGKYITYCLGNFCYGGSKNLADKDTGIFQQTFTFIDGKVQTDDNVRFIPCRSSSASNKNNYQPAMASGSEALRIINKMNIYSAQFGVVLDADGNTVQNTLTEQDKSNAFYAIFLQSLKETDMGSHVSHVGIDITSLELSNSTYLEGLLQDWADESKVNILIGSKAELIESGYHIHTSNGIGRIFIFERVEWANLQVTCNLSRLVTLLNYINEDFTAAHADGAWEVQKGVYIQK
jgi:hypothetical protein